MNINNSLLRNLRILVNLSQWQKFPIKCWPVREMLTFKFDAINKKIKKLLFSTFYTSFYVQTSKITQIFVRNGIWKIEITKLTQNYPNFNTGLELWKISNGNNSLNTNSINLKHINCELIVIRIFNWMSTLYFHQKLDKIYIPMTDWHINLLFIFGNSLILKYKHSEEITKIFLKSAKS